MAQLSSDFQYFSCFSALYCHWHGWSRQYFTFVELIDLNDDDIFDQSEANDWSDVTHTVSDTQRSWHYDDHGPPGSGRKNQRMTKPSSGYLKQVFQKALCEQCIPYACNERSCIFAIQSKFQLKTKVINFCLCIVHFICRDCPYAWTIPFYKICFGQFGNVCSRPVMDDRKVEINPQSYLIGYVFAKYVSYFVKNPTKYVCIIVLWFCDIAVDKCFPPATAPLGWYYRYYQH